jgi:segregation and condensation protein B
MQEITTTEKQELKVPTTLKALIEAMIFAAHEPLSIDQIKAIYQSENRNIETRQLEQETIRQIISDLNNEYEKIDRPYRIVSIAGGYQFATLSDYADWIGRLYKEQGRRKLSQSGIETLAIIAYKQPITKSEIEKIRGVNCDYVLKTLLEKELVTITGRAESVGRPLLYGTTREFLKHFGLNDITNLPRPREIEEILGESQFETERRMLEAQIGAEQMRKEQDDFKSRLPHIPKKKPELEQKEAEIIPRKRARDIRIVPSVEHQALEETGQEKIEFTPDEPTTAEQSIPEDTKSQEVSPELIKADGLINSEIKDISNDTIQQEQIIPLKEIAIEPIQEITSSPTSTSPIFKASDTTSSKNELAAEPEVLSSIITGNLHKSRWKIWKEKIQDFIKKLFD